MCEQDGKCTIVITEKMAAAAIDLLDGWNQDAGSNAVSASGAVMMVKDALEAGGFRVQIEEGLWLKL